MVRHDLAIYHKNVKALSILRGRSIIKMFLKDPIMKQLGYYIHININISNNAIINVLRCGRHLIYIYGFPL